MVKPKYIFGDIVMAFIPGKMHWGIHPHLILGMFPPVGDESEDPQYILLDSEAYSGTTKFEKHDDIDPFFFVHPDEKQNGLKYMTGFNIGEKVKRIQLIKEGTKKIGSLSDKDKKRFHEANELVNALMNKIRKKDVSDLEYFGQIMHFNLEQEITFQDAHSLTNDELKELKYAALTKK